MRHNLSMQRNRADLVVASQKHIPSHIVFDLRSMCSEVARQLVSREPGLSSILQVLTCQMPLPDRSTVDAEQCFYRLANHNRSLCLALNPSENVFSSPCLVFKGLEPLLADFEHMVDWMALSPFRSSSRVMADHFPLAEGKIPGCVSLAEAAHEAHLAANIQVAHYEIYGEFAHLPLPLLIHRFSDDYNDRCLRILKRKLASVAFERIELLLKAGLAIYVYYYPVAPIRADTYGNTNKPKVLEYLAKYCSPEMTTRRWIRLLVRLIYLGYLPATPWHEGLGACMDLGNACLDGGFCDVESIQPISACPDDEFFYESLISSLSAMQLTIAKVMLPGMGIERGHLYPNIEKFVLLRYVCDMFQDALEKETRPGVRLDDRVRALFCEKTFDDVQKLVQRKHRPQNLGLYLRRSAQQTNML